MVSQNFPERRIVLWSHPRSISTAFERTFIERDDTTVVHEPCARIRHRELLQQRVPDPECNTDEGARDRAFRLMHGEHPTPHLFVKDMAYYLREEYYDLFLNGLTNTFIIRDPERTLLSHYKKYPEFTYEEAGYEELDQIHSYVTEELGQQSIIVDGTDFRRHPQKILTQYLDRVGIPTDEVSLQWDSGELKDWNIWSYAGWHDEVAQTDRVLPPSDTPPDLSELPDRVIDMIPRCREIYEKLFEKRIRPTTPTQTETSPNPPQS